MGQVRLGAQWPCAALGNPSRRHGRLLPQNSDLPIGLLADLALSFQKQFAVFVRAKDPLAVIAAVHHV